MSDLTTSNAYLTLSDAKQLLLDWVQDHPNASAAALKSEMLDIADRLPMEMAVGTRDVWLAYSGRSDPNLQMVVLGSTPWLRRIRSRRSWLGSA